MEKINNLEYINGKSPEELRKIAKPHIAYYESEENAELKRFHGGTIFTAKEFAHELRNLTPVALVFLNSELAQKEEVLVRK